MSIGRRGGVLVLAVLLAACGRDGVAGRQRSPAGAPGSRAADAGQPAEGASAGGTLYRRACVMCHGERGAGTQLASALNDRQRTDAEVRTVAEYVHGLAK